MHITIITNPQAAEQFIKAPPGEIGRVISFTPEVTVLLKKAGVEAFFLTEEYGNLGHGRNAVEQSRAYAHLKTQLLAKYKEFVAESVSASYWWFCAVYFRIYYSLRSFDSFAYYDGDCWQSTKVLDDAVRGIFDLLQARKGKSRFGGTGFLALPFYKLYNARLLRKLSAHKFIIITQNKRKLPKIAAGVAKNVVCLDFNRVRLSRVIKAFKDLKKGSGQFSYLLYPDVLAKSQKIDVTFHSKLHEQAFVACEDLLVKNLQECMSYRASYARLVAHKNAGAVLSDYIAGPKMLPFCAETRGNNIPVYLVNHGSHVAHKSRLATMVDATYARFGRVCSPYADYLILRNPLVFELAAQLRDEQEMVRANLSKVVKSEKAGKVFTILHAGNFTSWDDHVPWITETAEEFMLGVKDLADVVRGLENCRLIIRVKSKKKHCNARSVRAFVGEAGNIEVKDDAEFYADLANADLLVAANSNTIHEALENQVPVLLYSYRNRYHHGEPDGKVVYGVKDKGELAGLLRKLIAAKADNDLPAKKNFDNYAWDETVFGEAALCNFIAEKI